MAAGQGRISQQRADEKRKKASRREWKCSLQELRILSRKFRFDSLRNAEPHRGWWWRSGPIRPGYKEIAGGPLCSSLAEERMEAAAV